MSLRCARNSGMVTRCVAAHFVAQNLTLSVETLLLGRNVLPHPRQVAGGVLGTALLGRLLVLEQSSEHVRFRVTCSFVWQRKGLEQTWHVFQNGYVLFALKCLGVFENRSSASFNKAAMVSRDELVCMISEKTVGGILVWVDVDLLDGLPLEAVMLCIIAECETPFHESMVRFPPYLGKDLCVLTQAAEAVVHAVANLEPNVLDRGGCPVRCPRDGPDEHVPPRLQNPEALGHDRLHEPDELGTVVLTLDTIGVGIIPLLRHKRDARWRVRHHGVDGRIGKGLQDLSAIPVEDLVRLKPSVGHAAVYTGA